MHPSDQSDETPHLHVRRWGLAALLTAATYAGILIPLQAVEILHFRIYEVSYEPPLHFAVAAATIIALGCGLGLAMGGIGFFREGLLNQKDRPWPWWAPIAATAPIALASHVLDSLLPVALPLLAHVVAGGSTSERRWLRLGALISLCLALALSNPVRYLYAQRVVRVFHYHRLRYMDLWVSARRPGETPQRGEGYLTDVEDLPLRDGELFWLGIDSITHDPWGNPYHFDTSRWMAEGHVRPDFGRWNVDYTFSSLGADGRRGGTGSDADILPEHVIPAADVPPRRPAGWDNAPGTPRPGTSTGSTDDQ